MALFGNIQGGMPYINMAVDLGIKEKYPLQQYTKGTGTSKKTTEDKIELDALPRQAEYLYRMGKDAETYQNKARESLSTAQMAYGDDTEKMMNSQSYKDAMKYNQLSLEAEKQYLINKSSAKTNVKDQSEQEDAVSKAVMDNDYVLNEDGTRKVYLLDESKKPVAEGAADEKGNVFINGVQTTFDSNLMKYKTVKDHLNEQYNVGVDAQTGYVKQVDKINIYDKKQLGSTYQQQIGIIKADATEAMSPIKRISLGDDIIEFYKQKETNSGQWEAATNYIYSAIEANPNALYELRQQWYLANDMGTNKIVIPDEKIESYIKEKRTNKKNNSDPTKEEFNSFMQEHPDFSIDQKSGKITKEINDIKEFATIKMKEIAQPALYEKMSLNNIKGNTGLGKMASVFDVKTPMSYWAETTSNANGVLDFTWATIPGEEPVNPNESVNTIYGKAKAANSKVNKNQIATIKLDPKNYTQKIIQDQLYNMYQKAGVEQSKKIKPLGNNTWELNESIVKDLLTNYSGFNLFYEQMKQTVTTGMALTKEGLKKEIVNLFYGNNFNAIDPLSFSSSTARWVGYRDINQDKKDDVVGSIPASTNVYGFGGKSYTPKNRSEILMIEPKTYRANMGVEGSNGTVETKESMIYGDLFMSEREFKNAENKGLIVDGVTDYLEVSNENIPADLKSQYPWIQGEKLYYVSNLGIEHKATNLLSIDQTSQTQRTVGESMKKIAGVVASMNPNNFKK